MRFSFKISIGHRIKITSLWLGSLLSISLAFVKEREKRKKKGMSFSWQPARLMAGGREYSIIKNVIGHTLFSLRLKL
jgi:hypothetical protein